MAKRTFIEMCGGRIKLWRKSLGGPRSDKSREQRCNCYDEDWDRRWMGERSRPVIVPPLTTAPIAAATWDERDLVVIHDDGTMLREQVRIRPRRILRRLQVA